MNKQLTSGRVAGLVLLGFWVMFLSSSIKGIYQVYFSDLALSFGGSRGTFALSGAIFMLVMGVASPVVGALSDKVGPLKTVVIGSVLGGASLSAASIFSHSFPIFVLAYGVVAAFALASMTYVPMGILVDRLFQDRNKGLAYAIVTNGTSMGFIALSPVWIYIAPRLNWQIAFLVVGLIFLIPISLAMFFLSRTEVPAPPADAVLPGTWSAVLKDPRFFALGLSFMSCGATMAFVDVHLVPFWEDSHVSRTSMGLSLSTLGLLELFSGVAAGWLASRYAKNQLLGAFYILRTLAMVMLLSNNAILLTYVFAAVFGISYLGTVVLTSAYCFDFYGPRIKGQAFGALFLVHQIGAFTAVRWGGLMYDTTHSYTETIIVLLGSTGIAGLVSFFALPGLKKLNPQAV
jgi:MFS family permease